MFMKNKKVNIIFMILSPFMYFCLGCYYTLYGLCYPFILLYNTLTSRVYRTYSDNKTKKGKKEVIKAVNMELTSIDEKINKNNELRIKEKLNKKLTEKNLKSRDLLISEINSQESVRTEFPNTYKYTARNSEGNDVVGYLVAYTKQEVFNFLESEG